MKNIITRRCFSEWIGTPRDMKYGDKGFMKHPYEIVEKEEISDNLVFDSPDRLYTNELGPMMPSDVTFFDIEKTEEVKKNLRTYRRPHRRLNKAYWDNNITATPLRKLKVQLLSFNIVYKVIIGTLTIITIINLLTK